MKNNKKPTSTKLSPTAQCAIAFTLLYLAEFCSLLLGKEITSWSRYSSSSRPLEEGPLSIIEAFERMETTGMVYLSLFVLYAVLDLRNRKKKR